jgi:SAM-dependent methyltransferase
MNRDYWDALADHWDEEIFNSLAEDRDGVIRRAIRRAGRRGDSVLDFGCGVGGYLPLLARRFRRVHAVDWSAPCVDVAARRAASLGNVTVERSTPRALARLAGAFDCVIAANVVIHPETRVRRGVWRTLRRVVRRGATAIVVVPSLESAAFCEFIRRRTAPRRGSAYDFHPHMRRPEAGVVGIDGVPTKHHTHEELTAVLTLERFQPFRISRVHYSWTTENLTPPSALRADLPWDWLAEAQAI